MHLPTAAWRGATLALDPATTPSMKVELTCRFLCPCRPRNAPPPNQGLHLHPVALKPCRQLLAASCGRGRHGAQLEVPAPTLHSAEGCRGWVPRNCQLALTAVMSGCAHCLQVLHVAAHCSTCCNRWVPCTVSLPAMHQTQWCSQWLLQGHLLHHLGLHGCLVRWRRARQAVVVRSK